VHQLRLLRDVGRFASIQLFGKSRARELSDEHVQTLGEIINSISLHQWQHFNYQFSTAREIIARSRAACECCGRGHLLPARADMFRALQEYAGSSPAQLKPLLERIAQLRAQAICKARIAHMYLPDYYEWITGQPHGNSRMRAAVFYAITEVVVNCDDTIPYPAWLLDALRILCGGEQLEDASASAT
jgi:hypothetical protein